MGNNISIRIAKNSDELERVFRFRYKIYVEEMNRTQFDADHKNRRIEDPLDETAINLAAWANGEVIGAIRNNAAQDGPLGMYESFYGMTDVGSDHPTLTSITTRLMIAPMYRKSALAIHLANESYRIGLQRGIQWNFIDCNPHLRSFFLSLGWIEHLPPAEHPEYGLVHRMRLDLANHTHLEALSSPFAKQLQSLKRDHGVVQEISAKDFEFL